MSYVDPAPAAPPPTTTAPSVVPLNAASLTRLAAALIAGFLIQNGWANQQQSQEIIGLIVIALAGVWSIVKNLNVVKNIIGALQAPAQVVLHPTTGARIPPVVQVLALIAILCLPGISMVACAPLAVTSPPAASSTTDVAVAKTVYSFEKTYNTAAHLYLDTWAPGKTAAQKAPVKDLLGRAYVAVQAAEQAQALGQAQTLQQQVQAVTTLVGQAMAIMNPQPAG